jgi:hypothetical protein
MKTLINFIVFILIIYLPVFAFSQNKFEKEYRIKPDKVPIKALQFFRTSNTDFSKKWYYEENQVGNSVEAKFNHSDERFSVEFDTLGNFQDIEVEKEFDELPKAFQERISAELKNKYTKHKIRRLQVQYSGAIKSFQNFLDNENPLHNYHIYYELIVKGKSDKQTELYEITFNPQGEMVKTEKIIFRNTDNLEF